MSRKYALLIHPGERDSILRNRDFSHGLPPWLADGLNRFVYPKKLANVTGLVTPHSRAEGLFLSINLTSEQASRFSVSYVAKRIFKAGRLAEKLGARIVGVGTLSAAAGGTGVALSRHLKIAVTTGKSYTMAAVLEGSRKIVGLLGLELEEADVMVLGAASSPGAACAQLLAREGVNYLTLAGADQHRLDALARLIFYDYGVSCKLTSQIKKSAGRADLIILADSLPELSLGVEDFKPGAVVFGLSGFHNIIFSSAHYRSDILAIDESVIEAPGKLIYNINLDIPAHTVPASMVETMILALEGRFENYTLGHELRIGKVVEIRRMAAKHGFNTVGYRNFGRYISNADILRIKHHLLPGKLLENQAVRTGGIK